MVKREPPPDITAKFQGVGETRISFNKSGEVCQIKTPKETYSVMYGKHNLGMIMWGSDDFKIYLFARSDPPIWKYNRNVIDESEVPLSRQIQAVCLGAKYDALDRVIRKLGLFVETP